MIRPLVPADLAAAREVHWAAMDELMVRIGRTPMERTPVVWERTLKRIEHVHATDPDGTWVAEVDGQVVGMALALVRDGMWFLSLLVVDPAHQGSGVGRQLLDEALGTAGDRAWLLSTDNPQAFRRYRRSGFDLHPCFSAKGAPRDLPVVEGVQEGAYDGLLSDVLRQVRGAGLDADLAYLQELEIPLRTVDDADGRGFVLLKPAGPMWLAATTEHAARRLLVTALAEATEPVEVDWLTADQQWALQVCTDAGLVLAPGAPVCLRGQPTMAPYLPNGALG